MGYKKLDQIVYELIIEKIEKGQLNEKEHITEQVIADELKISRTPVRKAFLRLVEDNYLENIENIGVRVKKQKIDTQSFQERIDFIEHLVNYYLFNLEKRSVQLDVTELDEILKKLEDTEKIEDNLFEKHQFVFWETLLKNNKNQYAKKNMLKAFDDVLFSEGQVRFILKESRPIILKHLSQLIKLLADKDYPLSRRELRILFNQLKLNTIESDQFYK